MWITSQQNVKPQAVGHGVVPPRAPRLVVSHFCAFLCDVIHVLFFKFLCYSCVIVNNMLLSPSCVILVLFLGACDE